MRHLFKKQSSAIVHKLFLCLMLGGTAPVILQADDLTIRHLSNEQNIITVQNARKYLLLPIQDNAPEGKVSIVKQNRHISETINIRLARERVDYYVPLDLSAYVEENVSVDIQGMPANSICWKHIKLSDTFDTRNRETFRPLYHHTPAYGWMNDPNGMFYKDGTWHLYFQYNPYGSTWGNMSWGHSTSQNLVDWEFQGNAITPDAWGAIFSGSCVVDYDNTAGFGAGAVIAIYTSAKSSPWGDCQSQSIAYSLDNGQTFTSYEANPVLTSQERDFRDPKVFWYAPGKHWVMILAVGQEMQIYTSSNLKNWKKESSFGAKQGAHGGVWECPDLVELPVEGSLEKKWVLICNLNPGGPFGGSAAQYFVGNFDGKRFVNESPTQTKWLDWGKDNYATVTWSNAPQGRTVALGWMSNWQYQSVLPTLQYRGANTLPRDLCLYRHNGDYYLKASPVAEVTALRGVKKQFASFKVSDRYDISSLLPDNQGAYEVCLTLKNEGASKLIFSLSNDKGERVYMYYDATSTQFVMERSESGLTEFSKDFPAMTVAPALQTEEISLRIFIDRSSIEIFGENGKYVMTNRIFPSVPYNSLRFEAQRGSYIVKNLEIYPINR